jgi:SAM-dependent methyltransferase
MPMQRDQILSAVSAYYGEKVTEHGATARGVDWSTAESQTTRFRQLLKLCDGGGPFSLNDYGCGYGGLHDFIVAEGFNCEYRGFDVAPQMLDEARRTHPMLPATTFVGDVAALSPADYTVASGVFNVKLATPVADWQRYVLDGIAQLARLSRKGFAFNMLTSYSDPDRMRADLYYGDPSFYFDHCKRAYSRSVALLHDYGLYEFTMIVRLEDR